MNFCSKSASLLLLTAIVVIMSFFSMADARSPIPVVESRGINPSCADPGEDPHLKVVMAPVPRNDCDCGGGSSGSNQEIIDGGKKETVKYRQGLFNKFDLFLYIFHRSLDNLLF